MVWAKSYDVLKSQKFLEAEIFENSWWFPVSQGQKRHTFSGQIDSLKKFFSNKQNLTVVSNLINLLDVKNYKLLIKKTPLSGKLIMFTGAFEDKSRSELKFLAENLGAKIVSSISKKTNFLIVGSQKPTIRKINEAKKLNIKILNEKNWSKIIN